MSRANNPQMGDDFAAVYEATAHQITGPVSNTALDIVGVGPGTRILDIAAGAGALSGPAAERELPCWQQTSRPAWSGGSRNGSAPSIDARFEERLSPFRTQASMLHSRSLA